MSWLREPDTEPIAGYRLLEPLGTGGFGEVWKCVAPGGIHKAIKFVYGNLNTLDDDSAKAEQEFKALERVKAVRHPFVLSMERIDIVGGELLIVMELADKSLHDLMQEYQKAGRPGVPRETLLAMLTDSAEGLDHLNEKYGLQHLDVKPKNLFLIGDRVKVADFGLVKHLERQSSSGIMGGITPVYAAPETFTNKISKHSDQYSLAVVFVEMLSGQRPFNGKNIRQLALQHMTEAPDLSMIPEADRAAVARALSKTPDDRFPSCLAFVRALGGPARADVTVGEFNVVTPPPRSSGPQAKIHRSPTLSDSADLIATQIGGVTPQGPFSWNDAAGSAMGLSGVFRQEEGVLRPAILIGVGSFGRRALQQVRCRLLDRIGELSHVPCLRFVYVDSDPEAAAKAAAGPADASLLPEHAFPATLQPVNGYRRRQLDQILEWLPREKLYSIPRSLRVEGSRALGRLAFTDHYLRFMTRMKHEIQVCTHPEALAQSADASGLPIKSKVPAVYVFASASGGTSGMILDVGQSVKRALEKFHIPDAPVTAFIFAGAPDDPASPPEELANIFATLTELNHYADPDVTFVAQYGGPEGPAVESRGLPFQAVYLLPMAQRSGAAFRDCISHLGGYVAHDLTTPLGSGLEKLRTKPAPPGRSPFRGFGTFGVWYPRGLLLRSAARQLSVKFLRRWVGPLPGHVPAEAEAALSRILADVRLTPEAVQEFIAAESATPAEGNPVEKIGQWVATLGAEADAAARRTDPATWATHVWDHARDMLGPEPTSDGDSPFRRGRLSKALDGGLKRAVEAWQNEFTEQFRHLEELPGPRAAAAEAVVSQLVAACQAAAAALEKQFLAYSAPRQQARLDVQAAVTASEGRDGGGFGLFGGKGRVTRGVADRVRGFAELRVREDLAGAAVRFYRRLGLQLAERLRDLALARERLERLADIMEAPVLIGTANPTPAGRNLAEDSSAEAMQTTLRASNTMRIVLPFGEDHLDRSAAEMLAQVPAGELARLEEALTKLVLDPRGGLVGACKGSAELTRYLGGPMVEQSTAFLSGLLPAEDVTAVELSAAAASPGELGRRIQSYTRAAAPLAKGPADEEETFVVVPDSPAGEEYASEVIRQVPGTHPVPVRGAMTDLLYCREQGCLRAADLFRLLEPCWDAYEQRTGAIETNPHARFDVPTWLPLVE